jgi:hypothetical protein
VLAEVQAKKKADCGLPFFRIVDESVWRHLSGCCEHSVLIVEFPRFEARMALFLSEKDVEQLLSMPMALEAVEAAHRDLSSGQALRCAQATYPPADRRPCIFCRALCRRLDAIGYKAYTSNRSGVRFLVHLYPGRQAAACVR